MKRNYSIIDPDGRLLSRLDIKPTGDGHELDVSFERNLRRALTVKKLGQARNTHDMLRQAFPERAFVVVQITKQRGRYIVDIPDGDRPAWIANAVESLGGTLIA
ncbi:hypothetical protein [Methylomonas koyamae]|uniref:hypothetical protein n=1 Tax=Methylomonas koyamae TaxID=702114 RepID=UPI000BC354D8|nr:hypothetical protein [Methylomonas koyamae]ATG89299.1 hypothetical protein MKLM6_1037 [Methylomonas koyamae]